MVALSNVSFSVNYKVWQHHSFYRIIYCIELVNDSDLSDLPPSSSYHNLFVDYSDILPASDQLLLLMHSLGGSGIPDMLLKSIRSPQRRWSAAGEMESHSASEFGLPAALIELASDDNLLSTVLAPPYATRFVDINDGGTVTWSLSSELSAFLTSALQPQTVSELETTALRVICFACPPCYEGNTFWYVGAHTRVNYGFHTNI